jgi:hypothetical protein
MIFLKGLGIKTYLYLAAFFVTVGVFIKFWDAAGDNREAEIQKIETDKFEESRDAVAKEQQESTGLSNSDLVDRMYSRRNK